MILIGQICLLSTFVAFGYAAFACVWCARCERRTLLLTGQAGAVLGVFALTVVMIVLAWALLVRDFSFNYVAQCNIQAEQNGVDFSDQFYQLR
jgi:cytochrome c biogenesis factor